MIRLPRLIAVGVVALCACAPAAPVASSASPRGGPASPSAAPIAKALPATSDPVPASDFQIEDASSRARRPEDVLRQVAKLECLHPVSADGDRGRTAGSLTITGAASGVTNHHVIAKCARGEMRAVDHLHNRVRARVLASDPRLDIALVGFDAGLDVEPVTWGGSVDLPLGSRVWVAGNAEGQGLNLSSGVLSGRHRTIEGTISTDAAVNPGNSGGPIFSDDLALIGLITLKERAEGISYAIPVEQVRKCAEDLARLGYVEPAWFGTGLSTSRRRVLDHPVTVREVEPHSPAAQAGLVAGDRVVAIAGAEVLGGAQAVDLLKRVRVGDEVAWTVLRGDARLTFQLRAGERPPAAASRSGATPARGPGE